MGDQSWIKSREHPMTTAIDAIDLAELLELTMPAMVELELASRKGATKVTLTTQALGNLVDYATAMEVDRAEMDLAPVTLEQVEACRDRRLNRPPMAVEPKT